jgi:hypothetical protein
VDALLVDMFLEAHERVPHEIVLDLDNTDIPLHGMQDPPASDDAETDTLVAKSFG